MKQATNPKLFMILTAASFVLGSGVTFWQYSSASTQADEVARLQKLVQNEDELKKKLDDSTKKLSETSSLLSHLEKGVPQLAYVPTLLFELESIGRSNGIEVLGVRPVVKAIAPVAQKDGESSTERRKPYEEMNIEVKGRGNYRSVMNFLKALQKFPKIVEARAVSLNPKQPDPSKPDLNNLDVSIELRAYLFKPSERQDRSARKLEGVDENEG